MESPKSLWTIADKLLSLFYIAMAVSGLALALAFEHSFILFSCFGFARFFIFANLLYKHLRKKDELKTLRHSVFCLKFVAIFVMIEIIPLFAGMLAKGALNMGSGVLLVLSMILIEIILSYRIGMIEEILLTAKSIRSKETE